MKTWSELKSSVAQNFRNDNASIEAHETEEEVLQYIFEVIDAKSILAEHGPNMEEWSEDTKEMFEFLVNAPFQGYSV